MATNIKKYEMLANDETLRKLYAKVNVLDSDSCWNWTGTKIKDGYGVITRKVDNKIRTIFVHRLSWMSQNGEIPDGMVIDHICHTLDMDNCVGKCEHRSCINPTHLRITTTQDNLKVKRHNKNSYKNLGYGKSDETGLCRKGHIWEEGTFVVNKNGKRSCITCRKESNKRSMANAKAKAGAM